MIGSVREDGEPDVRRRRLFERCGLIGEEQVGEQELGWELLSNVMWRGGVVRLGSGELTIIMGLCLHAYGWF